MLFSSIPFLYYFLPAVLLLYFAVPFRWKNLILLAVSLFFYFYGEPIYVLLMIGSTLSAYIHGLLIDRFRGGRLSGVFLWSSVITNLGLLGLFKYSDFFVENINLLTGWNWMLPGLVLPVGISFYTFQTLSYTVDVYRGDAAVQRSYIRLAAYVSLFPQLIAGPIVRYSTVEEELSHRRHSIDDIAAGITRFVLGLGKKVLLANQLGELCDAFRQSTDQSVLFFWLYAIAFSLHIYFDFSGYSDMAIGLGRIFGFHFLENFHYPYISKSISEFWRRWHISLGSWFRDYVYIPLGGNRVSRGKWLRNILVVWLLTGLWHGAAWNFVAWGLLFAVFLVAEKFFLGKYLEKLPAVFSHIYVLFVVVISFVIFNASGMTQAISDIGGLFGGGGIPLVSREALYYLRSFGLILVIGIVGATPLPKAAVLRIRERQSGQKFINLLEPATVVALLVAVTAYLVDGSFNPFLYFRF